eukprot:TRINITY_DN783_c0_g1_i1.p1 TRINITY_DN783_c0_g1~~TRINITY_DN783_c0_g1_i1.p1  ORF type:complete len:182 (+),score=39.78 TRINITY_DN783_c0_g1_i1:323-868(+)
MSKWGNSEREHWTDMVVTSIAAMYTKNAAGVFTTSAGILLKLTDNILDNPTEEKYREIRLRNNTIKEKLLKCEPVLQALEGMGWNRRVVEMEEKMFWDRPAKDLERLRLGKTEVVKYLTLIKERSEADPKEKERKEREEVMKKVEHDKVARAESRKGQNTPSGRVSTSSAAAITSKPHSTM